MLSPISYDRSREWEVSALSSCCRGLIKVFANYDKTLYLSSMYRDAERTLTDPEAHGTYGIPHFSWGILVSDCGVSSTSSSSH